MDAYIVLGGVIDSDFLKRQLNAVSNLDFRLIAVDKGLIACLDAGITPDMCIGDFDSAGEKYYEKAIELKIETIKLNPIKDDTDSEAALRLAIDRVDGDIYLLGATGARIDHLLGNVALLGLARKMSRRAFIVDEQNRIQLLGPDSELIIKRDNQFGKYISIIPYMGIATKVTLQGFKYPLEQYDVDGFTTLTVSNEITADCGRISLQSGYLIILETRD